MFYLYLKSISIVRTIMLHYTTRGTENFLKNRKSPSRFTFITLLILPYISFHIGQPRHSRYILICDTISLMDSKWKHCNDQLSNKTYRTYQEVCKHSVQCTCSGSVIAIGWTGLSAQKYGHSNIMCVSICLQYFYQDRFFFF